MQSYLIHSHDNYKLGGSQLIETGA
jgi:hypothetical protein